jgi:hypothetical protein
MVGMVSSVRIGIVDGLERYLMYRLGWWMDWKGACPEYSWVCGKSSLSQRRTGSRE